MSGHTYTHTYTHTHDNYYNPRCVHAHRGLITKNYERPKKIKQLHVQEHARPHFATVYIVGGAISIRDPYKCLCRSTGLCQRIARCLPQAPCLCRENVAIGFTLA